MFPLDELSRSVPAYQSACHLGVDVMGLLLPQSASVDHEIFLLIPRDVVREASQFSRLFFNTPHLGHSITRVVSRADLRDQVLVFCPAGKFLSTDELMVSRLNWEQDHCLIELAVTHWENDNLDGLPAPRDLYLVLCIETGSQPLHSVELRFSGRERDSRGNETALTEPVAPPKYIEVSD